MHKKLNLSYKGRSVFHLVLNECCSLFGITYWKVGLQECFIHTYKSILYSSGLKYCYVTTAVWAWTQWKILEEELIAT